MEIGDAGEEDGAGVGGLAILEHAAVRERSMRPGVDLNRCDLPGSSYQLSVDTNGGYSGGVFRGVAKVA